MFGRISLWAAGAALAGLMLPSQAMAQYDAQTRADLNLRVGPGTDYGVIDVIPAGYPVDVLGCLDAYEWCDIEWDGLRGWVSARYLAQPDTGVYLPQYAPRIGVPIISFSFGTYHDRYYRDRPWHRERHGRWADRDWRDRDRDDDDDRDWDRDDDDDDDRDEARDRDRDEAQERREAREREERREAREREERREAQEREARREAEQQRQQRQQRDAERPQQQQEREARPQQQREREAQPQQREREARPQQGARSQRQGNRPQQGQRVQRRGNGGPPEELTNDRGQ